MLFTGLGRSVWEKTVPLVLSTALGLRPRAVLKTSGTVFPIRTSRPVNNIYISLDTASHGLIFVAKDRICYGKPLKKDVGS